LKSGFDSLEATFGHRAAALTHAVLLAAVVGVVALVFSAAPFYVVLCVVFVPCLGP
jgi:cytochrome c oxidase assembly protein Cox11